ncbi:hypothetical protein N7G274_005392 [Stereocaulon virgatum]|uniref:Trafficking protein particle complex subunit 10 n=1 Tax=Stereocaulon virgatum TaxID=373712 RepID=A0ABR4A7F4_9LECA
MEKPPAAGVTVEYSDPWGIYHSVAHELHERLPLKGLHWNNPSGFIRSIDNLYIELVPDDRSNPTPESTSFDDSSSAQDSGHVVKIEASKKERRHQFPGLRRTPYLKIYLLICSDVDTYRASSRQSVREWVKGHTPSVQSSSKLSKQENHDAFEWLIVHVLPTSADGFRPSSSAKPDSNVEKRPTSSRWPSRSSSSVIEKIRSDFNGASKNAVDRVAQIHLAERPAEDSVQIKRRSQDGQNGWDDLMTKLKALILTSFGLRVSQYEEDIKEKEMQRSLPGWNFNTFFVLKEGLAMGFENIGLLEDALTVYRELAVGLKAVIDEQDGGGDASEQTTRFSLYTDELKEAFERAINLSRRNDPGLNASPSTAPHKANEHTQVLDLGSSILDTDRKPFRNLILESNISVFDFQCYVYARQMTLLLRLANVLVQKSALIKDTASNGSAETHTTKSHLPSPSSDNSINLPILAESIELSTEFIASTTQIVREDIRNAVKRSEMSQYTNPEILDTIHDDLTDSWTFSASQCILEMTSSSSLSKQLDPLLRQLKPNNVPSNENNGGQATDLVHRHDLPNRTSSLPLNAAKPKPLSQEILPSVTSLDAVRLLPPGTTHPGASELAAQRGDLLYLARRVLSSIGFRHGGWRGNLADVASTTEAQDDEMQDIDLEDELKPAKGAAENSIIASSALITAGISDKNLLSALESSKSFYTAYEDLTALTLACYVVGDRRKAAEAMTADLAYIRFQLKDYSMAASYFRQLAPFYAKDGWSNLETVMLDMYTQCLKYLGRIEDYVHVALRTLAKAVRSTSRAMTESRIGSFEQPRTWHTLSSTSVCLKDIIAASVSLDQPVSVPMDKYFDNIRLDTHILHSPDHDGFTLNLQLRNLIPEDMEAVTVRARLISVGEEQRSELWLTTEGVRVVKPGMARITLRSNIMLPGWYVLGNLSIQSSNIIFVNDSSPTSNGPLLARSRDSASSNLLHHQDLDGQQRLLIWAGARSLEGRVVHCEETSLDQPRLIKLEIVNGKEQVTKGKLLLRAASAGLRLHTAEAVVLDSDFEITDKTQPGSISFGGLPADTTASIRIPYGLESDLRDIVVRMEVMYTTSEGDFAYACNSKIPIFLPLAINVQDVFKQNMLFSRFTIGTATSVPLRIFKCSLEGNSDFRADAPSFTSTELDVFDLQPLSFISRIRHRSGSTTKISLQRKMYLHIDFRCLDEEICAVAERLFHAALVNTPFLEFSRILEPTLSSALRRTFSAQNVEASVLHRRVHLGSFAEIGWEIPLAGLHTDKGNKLREWLRNWHENHQTFSLEGTASSSPMQHLIVPVDVPQVQVLLTVRLKHMSNLASPEFERDCCPIGQGLPTELTIHHTQYWDGSRKHNSEEPAFEFCYEVHTNTDWLIGGQRKGHYIASEGDDVSFSLLLWPQRIGRLLLPPIDIRPSNDGAGEQECPVVSCEMDYRDQSRTILVASDLSRTTVNLDPSGGGGGWLMESQSRKS